MQKSPWPYQKNNPMKQLLILFFLVLSFHTGIAQQKDSVVNNFFEQMGKGNWTGAMAYMDANAKKSVTPDVLKKIWQQIELQYGEWKGFTSQKSATDESYNIIYADNDFSRAKITFRVVLDNQHKILGFFLADMKNKPAILNPGESEDTVHTADGGILYGTLKHPKGKGHYPVALIIAGSGPTDRNGNNPMLPAGQGFSYEQLADGLAANGIASLRYDKRFVGESRQFGKPVENVTLNDFLADAIAWIGHLERSGQFSGVSVIGHSEGALLGIALANNTNIKSLVSLSGPAEGMDKLLLAQLKPRLADSLYQRAVTIMDALKERQMPGSVPGELKMFFNTSLYNFWQSAFTFDPCALISGVKVPVLIINGTADVQVPPAQAEMLQHCNTGAKLVLVKGMTHLLKDSATTADGHATLPLATGLVPEIAAFIKN
jgi:pimeloyl-ACP methyl ester carboxylesterase